MARFKKHQDDLGYRVYVTDILYAISKGASLQSRYWELQQRQPVKDPEKVVADVVARAGLVVKHEPA